MISKKASTSVSVLVLVVMTLILVLTALVYFNILIKDIGKEILDVRVIEDVYVSQEKFNFYVSQGYGAKEAINLIGGMSKADNIIKVYKELDNNKNKIRVFYEFVP